MGDWAFWLLIAANIALLAGLGLYYLLFPQAAHDNAMRGQRTWCGMVPDPQQPRHRMHSLAYYRFVGAIGLVIAVVLVGHVWILTLEEHRPAAEPPEYSQPQMDQDFLGSLPPEARWLVGHSQMPMPLSPQEALPYPQPSPSPQL